jgi:hypothetical protein
MVTSVECATFFYSQTVAHFSQANILVNENLQPMLADFGLAVMSDATAAAYSAASRAKGSARWMAPVRVLY